MHDDVRAAGYLGAKKNHTKKYYNNKYEAWLNECAALNL